MRPPQPPPKLPLPHFTDFIKDEHQALAGAGAAHGGLQLGAAAALGVSGVQHLQHHVGGRQHLRKTQGAQHKVRKPQKNLKHPKLTLTLRSSRPYCRSEASS